MRSRIACRYACCGVSSTPSRASVDRGLEQAGSRGGSRIARAPPPARRRAPGNGARAGSDQEDLVTSRRSRCRSTPCAAPAARSDPEAGHGDEEVEQPVAAVARPVDEQEPARRRAGQRALGDPGRERRGEAGVDRVAALGEDLAPPPRRSAGDRLRSPLSWPRSVERPERPVRCQHRTAEGRRPLRALGFRGRAPRALPSARSNARSRLGRLARSIAHLVGPPGNDLAAHVYQRTSSSTTASSSGTTSGTAGRYSFVTYSVLYYPLAAVFGIKALAVLSIAIAALAFAVVVGRQCGPLARWSSRTFAVVWAGLVISAAFPFALGFALGAARALGAPGGQALALRHPRRPDGRREPARVPAARDLPRGHRARDARARPAPARARRDPRSSSARASSCSCARSPTAATTRSRCSSWPAS